MDNKTNKTCHLTIGPRPIYNRISDQVMRELVTEPEPCLGSNCSAWCHHWVNGIPSDDGYCGLVHWTDSDGPRMWPDPAKGTE